MNYIEVLVRRKKHRPSNWSQQHNWGVCVYDRKHKKRERETDQPPERCKLCIIILLKTVFLYLKSKAMKPTRHTCNGHSNWNWQQIPQFILIMNIYNSQGLKFFHVSQNSISTTTTEWLVFREANAVNSKNQIKAINIWWPTWLKVLSTEAGWHCCVLVQQPQQIRNF